MNKYIVKNCPCYCEGTVVKGNQKITKACESIQRAIKEGEYRLENCCNIPNCKIKQIVELCKEYKNNYCINNGVHLLIGEILNLLEIEEVNE